MTILPFGRALERAAPKAARGGGSPRATPRVDYEQMEFAIRAERDKIAKANLFLGFLRAKGITGEVDVEEIEKVYWMLLDCPGDDDQWNRMWLSMSRALGKLCRKKQVRKDGKRRQVVVIPGAVQ